MLDPVLLEETFNHMVTHLNQKAPDGIIDVDLQLLSSLNLLEINLLENQQFFTGSSEQFYMVEADEKLTLFNPNFVIWMLPSFVGENASTYVFMAKNFPEAPPKLEIVFLAKGVYNTSSLVLAVLDGFLKEMKENDDFLVNLNMG
jgi:hypothetical protein